MVLPVTSTPNPIVFFCSRCRRKVDRFEALRDRFIRQTFFHVYCHGQMVAVTVADDVLHNRYLQPPYLRVFQNEVPASSSDCEVPEKKEEQGEVLVQQEVKRSRFVRFRLRRQ